MSEIDGPPGTPTRLARGWGWFLVGATVLAVAAAALLAIGVVTLLPGAARTSVDADAPRDMNGNAVQFDPGTMPSAEQEAAIDAAPYGEERFVVPAVGLDVPLAAMNVVDGAVTPPGFDTAYWVRNLGVSPDRAAEGTVYLAMHAMRNGAVGPGNYLIDIDAARARLTPATQIRVGELVYEVTGSVVVRKDQIGADTSVWTDEPGRLVVITCLQRPDGGLSVANVVITAELIEASGEAAAG